MYLHIKIFVRAYLKNTNHFVWSILRWIDGFVMNAIANLFLHERLKIPEAYSEPSQISNMEIFANLLFS